MEFCKGNVSTCSKSNNLPNMSSILMGFWKTKQTQQQKTNKQTTNKTNSQTNIHTYIQNKQTNKSYWNWTNLEPRNNLITCFLRCFNIHLNLGFLFGLNILKGFNKFNLFTLKKKFKKKLKNFIWGKPRTRPDLIFRLGVGFGSYRNQGYPTQNLQTPGLVRVFAHYRLYHVLRDDYFWVLIWMKI